MQINSNPNSKTPNKCNDLPNTEGLVDKTISLADEKLQ